MSVPLISNKLHRPATLSRQRRQFGPSTILISDGFFNHNSKPCRFEANLGRLRFLQLGSVLAPIKTAKSGRELVLRLAESTDSSGRLQP